MLKAIEKEIFLQREYLKFNKIETIYFGGGTPSLLNDREINVLLEAIYKNYSVNNEVEVSLEANPDDLTKEKLYSLKKVGINRLSIGIQAFSERVLKYLNRSHSCDDASNSLKFARDAGFDNISVDLIYGIPMNGHSGWENDLNVVAAFRPEHISAYCLTIEPKTVFGSWQKKGKFTPIDDEYAATQFETMISFLNSHGYEQYEISNFCLPGKYSKHNSNYWKHEKYLGIGPSAHSFNGRNRQFNISNNANYIKSIESGKIPFELDVLRKENLVNEYVMTSLRTMWGCDMEKIQKDYSYDFYKVNTEYIQLLIKSGLAILTHKTLYLTNKGKLLADQIASDLFMPN